MTFSVSHTAYVHTDASNVFETLKQVSDWPKWDKGLKACEAKQVAEGSVYTLTPQAGNPVQIKITKLSKDDLGVYHFADHVKLAIGEVTTNRRVTPINATSALVTQEMHANIKAEHVATFANHYWKPWSSGIIDSTSALASHTEISVLAKGHVLV